MERLNVKLDPDKYDEYCRKENTLPECRDLEILVKPKCTPTGQAGIMITFTVELPDGSKARAQATTLENLFVAAGKCVEAYRQGGHLE